MPENWLYVIYAPERARDTLAAWYLSLEPRIRQFVGFPLEDQHRHPPFELSEVARLLQRPQHTAAAALGGIVVGDDEGMFHKGEARQSLVFRS